MRTRREFIIASTVPLTAPFSASTPPTERKEFQYEQLRWVDESEDPSLLLETEQLALKVIDNTGLRTRPRRNIHSWMEPNFSHHIGYHGIRTLWRKDERRNVVQPFASWLNLQMLEVEGLELDPIDSRAWAGVGRGWPIRMEREPAGVRLMISRMPVSGIEYSLRITPSGADSIDFEMSFTLHKKTKSPAAFTASWPCYMSTYDEVQLHAPLGTMDNPRWQAFGDVEPFLLGDPVNYVHSQRLFRCPEPVAFPAAYGRIGSRVLAIMLSRPEARFFVVNAGGHVSYLPVQNPAWDFELRLPDYEPGRPFGLRGRLIYKPWEGAEEIVARYKEWARR